MNAPVISEVYTKYRSENLPDSEFLVNTLVDSFNVPRDQVNEFIKVFTTTLKEAELLEELSNGKFRVLDVSSPADTSTQVGEEQIKKLSKGLTVAADDTCFARRCCSPIPSAATMTASINTRLRKPKLKADRADADLYGTGKIIDQIWKRASLQPGFYWQSSQTATPTCFMNWSCSRASQACQTRMLQSE